MEPGNRACGSCAFRNRMYALRHVIGVPKRCQVLGMLALPVAQLRCMVLCHLPERMGKCLGLCKLPNNSGTKFQP